MNKWNDEEQRIWCWGFIIGFIITNIAYGLGYLISYWLS